MKKTDTQTTLHAKMAIHHDIWVSMGHDMGMWYHGDQAGPPPVYHVAAVHVVARHHNPLICKEYIIQGWTDKLLQLIW